MITETRSGFWRVKWPQKRIEEKCSRTKIKPPPPKLKEKIWKKLEHQFFYRNFKKVLVTTRTWRKSRFGQKQETGSDNESKTLHILFTITQMYACLHYLVSTSFESITQSLDVMYACLHYLVSTGLESRLLVLPGFDRLQDDHTKPWCNVRMLALPGFDRIRADHTKPWRNVLYACLHYLVSTGL